MEYIFGITISVAVILYISWRIAEDEQRKFDHDWELMQSAKREKQKADELMEVIKNVKRRMERK